MKLHPDSIVQLHDLYHRKEGDAYIIGNPETGEYMFVTPAELRALQLLNAKMTIAHVQNMLSEERDAVDLHKLLVALKEKRFIHKVGNRVISPKHEPLHEFTPNLRLLGGPSMRFLLILISIYGLWTLVWYDGFPSYTIFFIQDNLTVLLVTVLVFAWLLVAARQLMKYAAAQYLGIPVRFGFANAYHFFIPKTYFSSVPEQQEHYVLSMSLLSLTALTSVALLLSTFLPAPYSYFWTVAFAIGFIEILSECILFMDTDLAKLVVITTNIHKLNVQTARALKEDLRLLFKGSGKPAHPAVAKYAFFYMLSIVVAVLLVVTYIVPAMLYFLVLAFKRFTPSHPMFIDAFVALLFFSVDLLLYSFALLKHHPLNRNTFFVNTSLAAIVVASYILASVGVEIFAAGGGDLLAIVCTYALGVIIALFFEYGVRFAYPFTHHSTLFESVLLPFIAAGIPISVLFMVTYTAQLYVFAIILGIGMLTAVTFSHLHHTTAPAN